MSETVKVMVRARPMNGREKSKNCEVCINVNTQDNYISLTNPNSKDNTKQFSFDNVFDENVLQSYVYEESAFSLVESVVEGFNGTIFAYGQTGCGKTHTMVGVSDNEDLKGIVPRTFSHIVKIVNTSKDMKFLVRCSYIEIYNESIQDLLVKGSKQKLELKENPDKGVYIKDLSLNVVKTVEEMDKFMDQGNQNRAVGATQMNAQSSRSHSIFTLYIEASTTDDKGCERFTAGKLNLVDLAGSERQSKTQATGDRLKEATKINLSLSALGNVISALVDGKSSHIPYRDSKLTRLLQDSLGGNTKTIMIANISPADDNYDETLSTLRYASRAKNIKNKPVVNEDPKDAMLKEYANEIKMLKEMLQRQQQGLPIDQNQSQELKQLLRSNSQKAEKNGIIDHELNELQEKQNKITKENEQMQEKMKEQEQVLLEQKLEKERIEQLMKEMNEKMMKQEEVDQKETDQFNQMRNKMQKQAKQKKKLQEAKKKKEEEMLNLEVQYNSLQEAVDKKDQAIKFLKDKYKESQNEVQDLQIEHELEKEDLLETIREQEKDYSFYKKIAQMLLKDEEIQQLRDMSTWKEDKKEYSVPPFQLKAKNIQLPKLPKAQALELIENEKSSREMVVNQKSRKNETQSNAFLNKHKSPSKSISQNNLQNTLYSNNKEDTFYYQDNRQNFKFEDHQKRYSSKLPIPPTKLEPKKQLPKQLEPMTEHNKYNDKLEKNSISQHYSNPLFTDKIKLQKQNQLKPLEYSGQSENNNGNILGNNNKNNQLPLNNISNQDSRKPNRGIRLDKLTEVQ